MPEPATPVMHTVAYGANDIDTLKTLELSCERDEAHLLANIKSLQRMVTEEGVKVTAAMYQEVSGFKMGRLTLVDFTTDVDKQSKIAIHTSQGETLLFDNGKAFVNNKSVNVLVFRAKPA
jgi:hypothetical protein